MSLEGKKVYVGQPTFHHEKHLSAYSQSEIASDVDDLSDLLINLVYPETPTNLPSFSYRREQEVSLTDFSYEYIADEDRLTRWSNERSEFKVTHMQYLGKSAIANLFDIQTSIKVYKRNDEPEVIATDYFLEQMHESSQNIGLVKRADIAGRNYLVYEPMTDFDVFKLLHIIEPIVQRIRLDIDEREFYDSLYTPDGAN